MFRNSEKDVYCNIKENVDFTDFLHTTCYLEFSYFIKGIGNNKVDKDDCPCEKKIRN